MFLIDLLLTTENSAVTAESTCHWLKESSNSEEDIPTHTFLTLQSLHVTSAPQSLWEPHMPTAHRLGTHLAATGLGLLQAKVHPDVLSWDGVKQLYFEVLLWKHLKHLYVCDRVYRLVEIYLPDMSECYWRKQLPVHFPHLLPLLLARGDCLVITHVLCLWLGWGGSSPAPTGLDAVHIKNRKAISDIKSLLSSIFIFWLFSS